MNTPAWKPAGPELAATRRRTPKVPPLVEEVLRSPGQPLDGGTRDFMQERLGYDFSQVRIHSDEQAGKSARAIHAAAYTVGREVVFGEGQYAPQTKSGRGLLAHELTHVMQQGGAPVAGPLELAHPHDAAERQAEAVAAGQARPVHALASVTPGVTVQRSFLGGIFGGIAGAIGGALVGGLLGGPIGALIGGVAGFVGGALAADRVTTRRRSLSGPEIDYAKDVFLDSIDYSVITITRDSLLSTGAPKTIGNTIHLKSTPEWGHFKGDTMELTQRGMETLIHEMGHVWQYQNGGLAYIPESLWAQFKATIGGGSRGGAYDWRAAHQAKEPWRKWNPEQQAEAIEDYNKLLRKSKAKTATLAELSELVVLTKYMNEVWNRRGAPTFATPTLNQAPI